MQDLDITWPDGEARFSPEDSPIQVGRSSGAAVPLTEGSVSRRHLELTWTGTGWVASDSSTHGTFDPIGVRLAPKWPIDSETTIRLGGTEGVQVHIRPVPQRAPAGRPDSGADPGGDIAKGNGTGHSSDSAPPMGGPGKLFAGQGAGQGAAQPSGPIFEAGLFAPPSTDAPLGSPPAVRPAALDQPPAPRPPADPAPPPPSALDEPAVAPAGSVRLEGADEPSPPVATGGHPAVGASATIISDSTLRLSVDGQDYSFLPGAEVTVGRDPSCLVRLDEKHSLVSRRHLRISYRDEAWWLEDFSSKGTYIDHRQIKDPYKVEGAFIANLGDDDAGTPMRIITAGEHRVPGGPNVVAIAALVAAAVIPLLLLAILLMRNGSASGEPDFAGAKMSTVMLFGLEGGQGSGFFVTDDLIVTNQHVAVLSPQMLVGVSREADEPAQIEYATELVANHPFLDIAVLRVANKATLTANGPEISTESVGDIDLPAVTLGDSNVVTLGDQVFSTGFPGRLSITSTDDMGALRLPPVVATSGQAVSFTIWPGCSNPDLETFIPADSPPGVGCSAGGDVNRGVLLSTFRSGQGASGSAVFHENRVVGVVYAGAADEPNASLNITTAAFEDWLQEIIDTNQ